MRLVGCILNAIVGIIIVGVFYLNEIPSTDSMIEEGKTGTYQAISYHFIGIQGVAFINITSLVMGGIFSVQMACKPFMIQLPSSGKYTTKNRRPRSTILLRTSAPRSSSTPSTPSSQPYSTVQLRIGSTASIRTSANSSNTVRLF